MHVRCPAGSQKVISHGPHSARARSRPVTTAGRRDRVSVIEISESSASSPLKNQRRNRDASSEPEVDSGAGIQTARQG